MTLARFYGIHVWVLPASLLVLVGIHLFAVIRQGIAASPRRKPILAPDPGLSRRENYEREYAAEKTAGKPFWDALLKDGIVALVLAVVVVVAGRGPGAPLESLADPNSTNYVPRPEWYFLDMFQLLWYFTGSLEPLIIFSVFTAAWRCSSSCRSSTAGRSGIRAGGRWRWPSRRGGRRRGRPHLPGRVRDTGRERQGPGDRRA